MSNILELPIEIYNYFYHRFFATSNTDKGYIPTGRISFDSTEYDYFGNFENSTGTFTCSKNGLHAFFFSGYFADTYDNLRLDVYVNDALNQYISRYDVDKIDNGQLTQWWSLDLKKGDKVYISNYYESSISVNSLSERMNFMGYFVS